MNNKEKCEFYTKIGKAFFFVFITFGFILGIGGPILMNYVGIDMCPYRNTIMLTIGLLTSGTTGFYLLARQYRNLEDV